MSETCDFSAAIAAVQSKRDTGLDKQGLVIY